MVSSLNWQKINDSTALTDQLGRALIGTPATGDPLLGIRKSMSALPTVMPSLAASVSAVLATLTASGTTSATSGPVGSTSSTALTSWGT